MKYKPELLSANRVVQSGVDTAESHLVSMIREKGVRAGEVLPHYQARIIQALGSNKMLREDDYHLAIQRMVDKGWISVERTSLRLSDAGFISISY
jgi:DNA-binding transcriptional regulator PaaX